MKIISWRRLVSILMLISTLLTPQNAHAQTWWERFNKNNVGLIAIATVGLVGWGYWFYKNMGKKESKKLAPAITHSSPKNPTSLDWALYLQHYATEKSTELFVANDELEGKALFALYDYDPIKSELDFKKRATSIIKAVSHLSKSYMDDPDIKTSLQEYLKSNISLNNFLPISTYAGISCFIQKGSQGYYVSYGDKTEGYAITKNEKNELSILMLSTPVLTHSSRTASADQINVTPFDLTPNSIIILRTKSNSPPSKKLLEWAKNWVEKQSSTTASAQLNALVSQFTQTISADSSYNAIMVIRIKQYPQAQPKSESQDVAAPRPRN